MAHIRVLGAGYVGLCTGLVFSELGHAVTFVDVDPAKLETIRRGRAPFHEPGLDGLLGKLATRIATASAIETTLPSEFTFLCVGTPQGKDGSIDLTFIKEASAAIGRTLIGAPRGHIIVVKSTVVPGTAEDVIESGIQNASGLQPGRDFHVVSNPEFLKEGSALADAMRPDRIVIGARAEGPAKAVAALYDGLPGQRIFVTPCAAEMIKYASNAFLAAKVALSNEVANICAAADVDWCDVAPAVGADARIGPLFLRAGAGFGGSCFPKDVAALRSFAEENGVTSPLLDAVLTQNKEQPRAVIRMLMDELGPLRGKRIALLGLAFKPETDDVRESRAFDLWRLLREEGAEVICHDPMAAANFARIAPGATIVATLAGTLDGADAVVVQTEWTEYRGIDAATFRAQLPAPHVVIDGRRTFSPEAMAAAGVRYRAIGLGTRQPPHRRSDNAK
ncbi:MAG: UDP-glucose/GDP-mannose dehydrogenase family protein [Candidatus Thermoplasmatota archaeon]